MDTCNIVILFTWGVFNRKLYFLKYFTHFLYNYLTHNIVCFIYLNPYLLKVKGNEHDIQQCLLLLNLILGYTFEILLFFISNISPNVFLTNYINFQPFRLFWLNNLFCPKNIQK